MAGLLVYCFFYFFIFFSAEFLHLLKGGWIIRIPHYGME